MTGTNLPEAFLRQLPSLSVGQQECRYWLSRSQEVVIGRDLSCEVVLDSDIYGMVSRRHAVVRPLAATTSSQVWLICDLDSANGTYVNGRLLQGCRELQRGDQITLGSDGAEFVFECQSPLPEASLKPVVPVTPLLEAVKHVPTTPDHAVSLTQLFPIISTGRDLTSKAFLVPGIITVVFVVLMFATVDQGKSGFITFSWLLAVYIAGAAYYFVYQLCGKAKPGWVLVGSAVATVLILRSPILPKFVFFFRGILPGSTPVVVSTMSFPELLIRMFFGAGLLEELLKAIPVLALYLLGKQLRPPWRERIGIWEPLDGILIGTASAVGFTLFETLEEYVPDIIHTSGPQAGLQLLIPRVLGSVAGHMAYSGYFGYFIGLSVLKPRQSWQILTVGYLSAAVLHALWNATGLFNASLLAVVGMLSYAFLTAAILKARALSPTRSQNFATHFVK